MVGVSFRKPLRSPGTTTTDKAERMGMRPVMNEASPRGTTCLPVPTGEVRSFLRDAIDVRRRMPERRAATADVSEVPPAGVVGHEHDDVGFLVRRLRRSYRDERGEQCAGPFYNSFSYHRVFS